MTRLRLSASEPLPGQDDPRLHAVASVAQATVLDCVQALGQLHDMLVYDSQRMTQHDALTALPNRGFFRERLERACMPAASTAALPAVLCIDLDAFKPINDQHGHDVGDELLRIVALRLGRTMRSEDVLSRLGGNAFACLLAEAPDREQLSHVACKLFDAISAPLHIGRLQLSVRPSIGIAISPGDGDTAGVLLRHAEAAMAHAKRQQSGYAFFDSCPKS